MNNIRQWFSERKIIYGILSMLYYGNIDEVLEFVKKNALLNNFAEYNSSEILASGSIQIIKELKKNENNSNYVEIITEDYQRLFIGPDRLLAPPWKSVYKEKDKLLFSKVELEVRNFYNENNLDISNKEPADYLPLELSFMSRLCSIDGKYSFEEIKKVLLTQHKFLEKHFLSWIPLWIRDVKENSETNFWIGFSQVTLGFLQNDFEEIEIMLNS